MKLIVTSLPTYDAYKDSKVDWLGKIPKDWLLLRAKYIWNEIVDLSKDGSEILLSVSQFTGITKNNTETQRAESLKGYKIVKKNDLVSNIMLAWNGCLGISPYDGITSPAYAIYQLKNNSEFFPKYFHYLFRTDLYKAEFRRNSSGVIESRLRLYTEKFFSIPVCVPSLNEQTAIVNFLDKKTDQIDKVIAIKEQQIARLKEYQQITIQKAVTQGLNLNVAKKDSGIDWIGKIPKHWEVKKLKYSTKINIETLSENTNKDFEFSYVDISNVSFTEGITSFERYSFKNSPSRARRLAMSGDTIVSTVRTYLKAIAPIDETSEQYIYSTGFAILRPLKSFYSKYLTLVIKSDFFTNQVDIKSKGTSYPAINTSDLSNLYVLLPPKEEQLSIISFVEKQISSLKDSIKLYELQIEKLKEYKTTLINSAVTGKIKVV